MTDTTPATGSISLTQRAAVGVRWTATSTITTTLLQFSQVAFLTRILDQADFGLMAMILVVIGFGQAYADIGLSNAIIWRQDATRAQLSSLYWANMLAGLAVFVAILLLNPLIAAFYRQPELTRYLPLSALVFLIIPIGQQFQVLLQKELRFRSYALIEILAAVVGAATAIATGLAGVGVLALIAGQLAGASTRAAILASVGWRRWRPSLRLRLADLRGYISFGAYQVGERTVDQFSSNIDYLLIGRFLGSAMLGAYSIAYQLVVLPFTKINPVLTSVAYPVFARRQDDDAAICRGYLELSTLLVFVVFPLLVGLLVTAPVAVPVLFGQKWMTSVPLVQVLALMAMIRTLCNPVGSVLMAKGRADLGFKVNLVLAVATLAVFFAVVPYGTLAVAWAWVGMSVAAFVLWQMFLARVVHMKWKEYAATLARPVLLTALSALLLEGTYLLLRRVLTPGGLLFGLLILSGVAIHAAVWMLLNRSFVKRIYGIVKATRSSTR